MPGGFPLLGDYCNGNSLGFSGGTYGWTGVGLTISAANTKTAWTQLTASCPIDVALLAVYAGMYTNAAATDSGSIDIGIGLPGSEIVLIADLMVVGGQAAHYIPSKFIVPLSIPQGTPISIRAQAVSTSDLPWFACQMFDAGFAGLEGLAGCNTIGFNAATSQSSFSATMGAVVKGSWSQIVASTAKDYAGLVLGFDDQNTATGGYEGFAMDIGIGSSGSEIVIIPDIAVSQSGCILDSFSQFYPVSVPAGSRISVRGANISYATPSIGATIYGFYK